MEATKEAAGLLNNILPPRLEDAGLEDCALPPDSIKEAFFKAASAVKSRASTLFHDDDDDSGGCVEDPWPSAAKEVSDSVAGLPPVPDAPGPCGVVKGDGVVEEGKDKVVVVGGGEEEDGGYEVAVVGGGDDTEEGKRRGGCVEGLKGLSIEEEGKKKKKNEKPTLVEEQAPPALFMVSVAPPFGSSFDSGSHALHPLPGIHNPGVSLQLSVIKTLTGSNFDDWYESLFMFLGVMNLDLAMRVDSPPIPTAESSYEDKVHYAKWEYSNRNCLMIMNFTIEKSIRSSVPNVDNARAFMDAIKLQFTKFDKAEMSNLLRLFTTTKYDGVSGVREHILRMIGYYNKLKEMKVQLEDKFLIWQVLESLPSQFDALKSSYNAQKEEQDLNTVSAIIIQEVEILKAEKLMVSHNSTSVNKNFSKGSCSKKPFKKKKFPRHASQNTSSGSKSGGFKGECHFCHKFGHKRMNCQKFKDWKIKKGIDKQPEAK